MPDINERDAKLVQWLSEAYVKEAELEADLTAHISLTSKQSYRKRLQDHLKETHDHKKRVGSRIKQLGGSPEAGPEIPGVPSLAREVAGKAVAAVKGQLGAARAVVTEQAETHLRNAQEERREEQVEIAIYTRIQTLASEVGDKDTERLARDIRRQEERMAKFLDAELVRLVKEVVKAEIPRDQRGGTTRRRAASSSASTSRTGSRAASSGSRATKSGTRAASSRSGGARAGSAASKSRSSKATTSRKAASK